MSLSQPLRKIANRVIDRFGGQVTLRRVQSGVYNPADGTVSAVSTDFVLNAVLEDVQQREIDDLIQAGDKRATIAASDLGFAPTTADLVIIGGVTHQVITVTTVEQENQPIIYGLVLRK